jgi:hypothetical protein
VFGALNGHLALAGSNRNDFLQADLIVTDGPDLDNFPFADHAGVIAWSTRNADCHRLHGMRVRWDINFTSLQQRRMVFCKLARRLGAAL